MKRGYIKDLLPIAGNAEERALNAHTHTQDRKKRMINRVEAAGMGDRVRKSDWMLCMLPIAPLLSFSLGALWIPKREWAM